MLTEESSFHLRKYLTSRRDDNPALFVSLRSPYKRLSIKAAQAMLRKLGNSIGVHAHPHKFRRTFLTDASLRGMPLQELQIYAGHSKPETTMAYVSIKDSSIKANFNRLIA